MFKIHIKNLTFNAIIGLLDFERVNQQKIIINAKIKYDFENKNYINYADICSFIEKNIQEKKYFLLEDALTSITEALHHNYPKITSIKLKITKPNIIKNAQVAVSLFRKY